MDIAYSKNISSIPSQLTHFWKFLTSRSHEILFVLILCIALLLRLDTFHGNHYYHSDYNRDYLVAHHIVAYHEFPLTGPDGEFGSYGNSPAYFYLLALPLLLKDDIVFLGIFNLLLQMVGLIIMYLLARSMFGKQAGLIAFVLFGLAGFIVAQSNFVWQPWIMQPFFLLSLLLLHRAHHYKKYGLLLFSIGAFLFSATLHQSVYAIAPVYIFAVILMLRMQWKSLAASAGVFGMFVTTFIVLHVPLLFYFNRNQNALPSFSESSRAFLTVNFHELFQNLFSRGKIFWDFLLFRDDSALMTVLLLTGFFVAASIAYLCYGKQDREQKNFILILLVGVVQFFVIAVAVYVSPIVSFPVRYFTPLFGIVILCIAGVIHGLFSEKRGLWVIKVAMIAFLVFVFSPNLQERLTVAMWHAVSDPVDFLLPSYIAPPFIATIQNEIISIKEKERKQDLHFFSVRTYRFGREDLFSNEVFWSPLERYFNTPLVILDDSVRRDYRPIGNIEYIFISCGYDDIPENRCPGLFLTEFSGYQIEKRIYTNPEIYVAKRKVP
ncbi:MAG: Uncharacterized protein G01um101429_942 [Parcubacteria group bacterium Gr01-1014_29]|nr:MAG: Uncharacterized protein G01um101429_942 [Parcubacteria group bacterium Gr01-1014_29]